MIDTVSKKVRSQVMSSIRSRDTKAELSLRKALWAKGYRYRVNVSKMIGKPDVVFRNAKVVVFVDSCFWHRCPYHFRMPKSNLRYWKPKIGGNKKRDLLVNKHYKLLGWKVLRFWEHQIQNSLPAVISKIEKAL